MNVSVPLKGTAFSLIQAWHNEPRNRKETYLFSTGCVDEKFKARKDRPFKPELFAEAALETLRSLVENFKSASTQAIAGLSHMEEAWIQNHEERKVIGYGLGFGMGMG